MQNYRSLGEIFLDLSRCETAQAAGQRAKAAELRAKLHLDDDAGRIETLCKARYGAFNVETANRLCGEVCVQHDRSDYEAKQLPPREFIGLAKYRPGEPAAGATVAPKKAKRRSDQDKDGKDEKAIARLLGIFTGGLTDERFDQAAKILQDASLTINEKLMKIDEVIPFPATASAAILGQLLGVTKQAVLKTGWWTQHRKGERADEVGRRRDLHKRRAREHEPIRRTDEDE